MTPKMEVETFDYGLGPRGAADRARATLGDNIARGLVELITNSDTAYERRQEDFSRRRIAIEYSSKERWIAVRDQAGGMSREIARQKFKQGGEASEPGGRGYFGVGAKDCAVFGKLIVETVDDSGTFTRIDIPRNYQGAQITHETAQREHYDRILKGRKRPGTVATIKLAARKEGGPNLPRFGRLEDQLAKHFALRHLLERNYVMLIDRSSRSPSKRLHYWGAPWEAPTATLHYDGDLVVEGYPEARPHLKLFDVGEAVRAQTRNDQFEGFILVRTPVADHGYFLAGLESHPHAARLAGEVTDPYIQTLLEDFLHAGPSKKNDRAVIRQDRHPQNGGLETDHPYYEAITRAIRPHVAAALEAINAQLQESERAGISTNLQQANLAAGSWLGNYLEEDAGGMPSLPDGFYFLPSSVRMGPGTVKRLTLYNIGSDVCVGAPTVTSDDNDLVAINEVSNFSDPVLPTGATSPRQRARIVVTAGHQIGSATLVAEYAQGDREALLWMPISALSRMRRQQQYSVSSIRSIRFTPARRGTSA